MEPETIQPRPEYVARYEVQISPAPGAAWQTVDTCNELADAERAASRRLHDEGAPGVRIVEVLAFEVNPLFIT